MKLVLAGDVGGTHTRLQLVECAGGNRRKVVCEARYKGQDFCSFVDVVNRFLADHPMPHTSIEGVCIAVAGPVVAGQVRMTNLPWNLSAVLIKKELRINKVAVVNDFEAIGYGLQTLSPDDYVTLQAGKNQAQGIRALIGAGTGLGVALVTGSGQHIQVHATEGGHIDFAPTDDAQMQLLSYYQKKLHRVSIERFLSGPGLVNIYRFVSQHPLPGEQENIALRRIVLASRDSAEQIALFATQNDSMALRAMDLFVKIYGSMVGNLALLCLPFGGLYIAGGIAPKIIKLLQDGRFMQCFKDKGRMSGLLDSIPLNVLVSEKIGLQGAALYASLL